MTLYMLLAAAALSSSPFSTSTNGLLSLDLFSQLNVKEEEMEVEEVVVVVLVVVVVEVLLLLLLLPPLLLLLHSLLPNMKTMKRRGRASRTSPTLISVVDNNCLLIYIYNILLYTVRNNILLEIISSIHHQCPLLTSGVHLS